MRPGPNRTPTTPHSSDIVEPHERPTHNPNQNHSRSVDPVLVRRMRSSHKEPRYLRLKGSPPRSFLAGTLRLEYALNPGGFLSAGSNMPAELRKWIFVGFNSCTMLALCAFLILKRSLPFALFVSIVFILAGGIGNLIDRVWHDGLVTDFINLGVGPLRTGVFNVADMAATLGVIAIGYLAIQPQVGEPTGARALRSRDS